MIFTYKKVKDFEGNDRTDAILKTSDSTPDMFIPFDEANTDYQEYLLWISEGGVAEAAD